MYLSDTPFSVETIFKRCLSSSFYRYYVSAYSELSPQDTKIYLRLDTSPLAKTPWDKQPLVHHFPEPSLPKPTHTRVALVPEFDLSIPAAGDDLGGFVRVPKGADAHLVVSLDPVVQLGGLPVPNVQLSIRIS